MFFEQFKPGSEYRHIPQIKSSMLFGVGFFDKSNWTEDQTDISTDHYTLVYILNGRMEYTDNTGIVYKLKAGDYFQRIPGVTHTTRIDPKSHYFECFVVISVKCYEACKELGFIPTDSPIGHTGLSLELAESFYKLKEQFLQCSVKENARLALQCQEVIYRFFIQSQNSKECNYYSRLIEKACLLLCSDFKTKYKLEDFCRLHQCNYHTFRRIFNKYAGVSPSHYRTARRLDKAVSMLKEQRLNISEIAWELGYSSPFDFSAHFKRHFGISPLHFKNSKP